MKPPEAFLASGGFSKYMYGLVYKHACLDTLLLLHSAPMLCVVKMSLKGDVGDHTLKVMEITLSYPPANFVCGRYTVFTLSVRPSVRPSVTLCFLNIFKSHCWIFIKPCKHVYICKTNTLNKKVRARGQFY